MTEKTIEPREHNAPHESIAQIEADHHHDSNIASAKPSLRLTQSPGFIKFLSHQLHEHPSRVLVLLGLIPVALLSVGLYLQHVVGLVPCPMCIVQRYVLIIFSFTALLLAFFRSVKIQILAYSLLAIEAVGGAYVAAMQSWLQWYPPEVVMCGRDFYGMIETFPLKRAIPMIFKGGGDCSVVDWTFLGGSVANWSFVAFVGLALLSLLGLVLHARGTRPEPLVT